MNAKFNYYFTVSNGIKNVRSEHKWNRKTFNERVMDDLMEKSVDTT